MAGDENDRDPHRPGVKLLLQLKPVQVWQLDIEHQARRPVVVLPIIEELPGRGIRCGRISHRL